MPKRRDLHGGLHRKDALSVTALRTYHFSKTSQDNQASATMAASSPLYRQSSIIWVQSPLCDMLQGDVSSGAFTGQRIFIKTLRMNMLLFSRVFSAQYNLGAMNIPVRFLVGYFKLGQDGEYLDQRVRKLFRPQDGTTDGFCPSSLLVSNWEDSVVMLYDQVHVMPMSNSAVFDTNVSPAFPYNVGQSGTLSFPLEFDFEEPLEVKVVPVSPSGSRAIVSYELGAGTDYPLDSHVTQNALFYAVIPFSFNYDDGPTFNWTSSGTAPTFAFSHYHQTELKYFSL